MRVAGDTQSPRPLAATFEQARGGKVTLELAGSIEDLDHMIAGMRAADAAPTNVFPVWQQMQYGSDMASGLGRLTPLDNHRYPAIQPTTIAQLLAQRS